MEHGDQNAVETSQPQESASSEALPDSIRIGEDYYALKMTARAVMEIERRLDMGMMELARRVAEQRFGLRESLVILAACHRAAAQDIVPDLDFEDRLADAVVEHGVLNVAPQIVKLVERALMGAGVVEAKEEM